MAPSDLNKCLFRRYEVAIVTEENVIEFYEVKVCIISGKCESLFSNSAITLSQNQRGKTRTFTYRKDREFEEVSIRWVRREWVTFYFVKSGANRAHASWLDDTWSQSPGKSFVKLVISTKSTLWTYYYYLYYMYLAAMWSPLLVIFRPIQTTWLDNGQCVVYIC